MNRMTYAELLGRSHEYDVFKISLANSATAGYWSTSWPRGTRPEAGSWPASGSEVCDIDTTGALQFGQPGDGESMKLLAATLRTTLVSGCYIMDRLVHTAPLLMDTTATQPVGTVALPPRAGDGEGVEIWLELTDIIVANPDGAIVVGYTNSDGVSGRVSHEVPFIAAARQGTAMRVPLQTGDTGVRSVDTITFSPGWTGGSLAVVLAKRVALLANTRVNDAARYGGLYLGPADVPAGACLSFIVNGSTTTSTAFTATLTMAAA